jgi:hypothetical protein
MRKLTVAIMMVISGCATNPSSEIDYSSYSNPGKPSEYESIEAYINAPANYKLYQESLKNGLIESSRRDLLDNCSDEKKKMVGFCGCITEKLSELSDGEMYYNLMFMMEMQEKTMDALKSGDMALKDKLIHRMVNEAPTFKLGNECENQLKDK